MAFTVYPCRNVCLFVFVFALRPCPCRRWTICSFLERNADDGDWLQHDAFTLTSSLTIDNPLCLPMYIHFKRKQELDPCTIFQGYQQHKQQKGSEHFNKQNKQYKQSQRWERWQMGQTPGEGMWWAYIRVRLQQHNWPIPLFVFFPFALTLSFSVCCSSLVFLIHLFAFFFLREPHGPGESKGEWWHLGHNWSSSFVCFFALLFIQWSRLPFLFISLAPSLPSLRPCSIFNKTKH